MKISIAMAAYNGAEYIREQLDSFLRQIRLPDELVVCDDCSSDNTIEILKNFAISAPFEVLIYRNAENLGHTQNFSKALMRTTGDLVFLSDQDDIWFPEKIYKIETIAQKRPEDLFFIHDGELTDKDGCSVGLTKLHQIKASGRTEKNFFTGCCAAVKRELLEVALPIPYEIVKHDLWLGKLADSQDRKCLVTYILQFIRRHDFNVSVGLDKRLKKNNSLNVFFYRLYFLLKIINKTQKEINNKVRFIELMLNRIEKVKQVSINNSVFEPQKAVSYFKKELKFFQNRKLILSKRRIFRILPVIKLWFNGGYSMFSGINAAIIDLISP